MLCEVHPHELHGDGVGEDDYLAEIFLQIDAGDPSQDHHLQRADVQRQSIHGGRGGH